MQLRRPAADVMRLRAARSGDGAATAQALQARERVAVHRQRALGEAALDLQVLEVARDVGVARVAIARVTGGAHGAGSSRVSAALATSPMRARNSVPMSAV